MTEAENGYIPQEIDQKDNAFRKSSSKRLMLGIEKQVGLLFRNGFEVIGRENLTKIEPDSKIIFATTHTSDNDVPLAVAALGHDFNLLVTDMSIHRSWREAFKSMDPTILGIKIAGEDNFLPISHTQKKGVRSGHINSNDAQSIKKALESGKAVVIAAHNGTTKGKLPDNSGFMAIRAAQISGENTIVIPVAVQIGEPTDILGLGDPKNIIQTRRKKPNVKVIIGSPLKFDDPEGRLAGNKIEEILEAGLIPKGRELSNARSVFKKDGARLMNALAALLPVEKRGVWHSDSNPVNDE